MGLFNLATALCLASSLVPCLAAPQSGYGSDSKLPIVDLGYELHQAAFFNETGRFYNFSNIRYAAPPTGKNRFRAPQLPASNRGTVQTGSTGKICAQSQGAWGAIAAQFIPRYLAGQTVFNESSFNLSSAGGGGLPAQDPRTTEDCLFLDVVVPQAILENAGKPGCSAPVLVWIYGMGTILRSDWDDYELNRDPLKCRRWIHRGFQGRFWQSSRSPPPQREQ